VFYAYKNVHNVFKVVDGALSRKVFDSDTYVLRKWVGVCGFDDLGRLGGCFCGFSEG